MSEFEFRPAQPSDEPAVQALASQIWDGHDYIGQRFHEWLADPHGRFSMVYDGTALLGCSKITRLGPGEWWLEGLRVHPDYQGRGLGRAIHNYNIQLAEELAARDQPPGGMLRFTTGNPAVRKMAAETGFRLACATHHLRAEVPPLDLPTGVVLTLDAPNILDLMRPFIPAVPADEAAIRAWVQDSPWWQAFSGLMVVGWKWYEVQPRWPELLAANRAWWFAPEGERQGLVVLNQEYNNRLRVNYLDPLPGRLSPMLHALLPLTAHLGAGVIQVKLPEQLEETGRFLAEGLNPAGWQQPDDGLFFVYERPLTHTTQ